MTDERERAQDAALVARCLDGQKDALERLVEQFATVLCRNVAARWRYHGAAREEFIKDAAQDLFCDLLEGETRGQLRRRFETWLGTPEEFLTRMACRKADDLLRKERWRHRHEARAPVADEELERPRADWLETRAERLMRVLTPGSRERLRSLLNRTFSDSEGKPSEACMWQFAHRLRMKLREQDAFGTAEQQI
jgi:hypothetical protein